MNHTALDNPVQTSLMETHASFAQKEKDFIAYQPIYCPFGSVLGIENDSKGIDIYSQQVHSFFAVGTQPSLSSQVHLENELVCDQMILEKMIDVQLTSDIVLLESANQQQSLYDLVNLVQPGYFNKETPKLGKYFGIFDQGQLVAVTGERMKMNNYTEVSAVITHPEHTGKGYAKQLVAYVCSLIFEENKTPFLHVAETNIGAIKLYEKIGFTHRRKMSFWHLTTNE